MKWSCRARECNVRNNYRMSRKNASRKTTKCRGTNRERLHMIMQPVLLQNSSHQPPTVANLAWRLFSSRVLIVPPLLLTLIVYSLGSWPACGIGYHHLRVCPRISHFPSDTSTSIERGQGPSASEGGTARSVVEEPFGPGGGGKIREMFASPSGPSSSRAARD